VILDLIERHVDKLEREYGAQRKNQLAALNSDVHQAPAYPSGMKRLLSVITEVASVIVSDLPVILLMQACSKPLCHGMNTLVTSQRADDTLPALTM